MNNLAPQRFPGTTLAEDRSAELADYAADRIDPSFQRFIDLLNEAHNEFLTARKHSTDIGTCEWMDGALSDLMNEADNLRDTAIGELV